MFSRCFAIPKQCKTNKFLNLGRKRWAKGGRSWLRSSVALGAYLGVFEGFRSHTPPAYENSPLPALWCNRFPSFLSNFRFKGILRGFLWVYRCKMYIRLPCGFRGACGALCV